MLRSAHCYATHGTIIPIPSYPVCQLSLLSQDLLRQVQVHEPILVTPDSSSLKSAVEHTFAELSKAGVPINLVTFYDDLGFNYEWVVKLPVCPPHRFRQA